MTRSPQTEPASTLVFPAVNEAAFRFIRQALARGDRIVGAASVPVTDFDPDWGPLLTLPAIYDADFELKLGAIVRDHQVHKAYCPVASVHDAVQVLVRKGSLPIQLVGQSPIREQMAEHAGLMRRAANALPFARACSGSGSPLELLELAGILKQASVIYGESNDEKLAAMVGVAGDALPGDVVEIGSLMGRSAFVLRYLAWRQGIGPVLSIDPWSASQAIQHQSPKQFQSLVDEWDFEVLREGFFLNMLPIASHDHAHLRMTSEEASDVYLRAGHAISMFGRHVDYSRQVALLHIDGNHDLAAVALDCELWVPQLRDGGWLILDDYLWAHGDGPYRVGNRMLDTLSAQILRSFVAGKALFVQFKHAPTRQGVAYGSGASP